jgi:RNA polymerase sigma-70 factor (ECF subfamily)
MWMGNSTFRAFLFSLGSGRCGDGTDDDAALLERFVRGREEEVFAAILRRHGPMVFAVCRRALGNEHDVEDAFQATFLVLARKAASIGVPARLGNWLYGVAYRTAIKARSMNRQRRAREQGAGTRAAAGGPDEALQHLRSLLDEELNRLPEQYRTAIVLCDLQGQPIKATAKALGWAQGTLASRLARGRELLRKRLVRRTGEVAQAAPAALLTQAASGATIPPLLIPSTLQGALSCGVGPSGAGATSSTGALSLAKGVLRSMLFTKLKLMAGALAMTVFLGFVLSGVAGGLGQAPSPPGGPEKATAGTSLPGAADKAEDEADKEVKLLQGEWKFVAVESDGKSTRDEVLQRMKWTFKGTELISHNADGSESKSTFKIAPGKAPKEIDLTALDGDLKDKTTEGIYELEGGRLKVCLRDPKGKETGRPKKFDSTGSSGLLLLTLEKEAPAGTAKPLSAVKGRWRVVQAVRDGEDAPAEELKETRFVFDDKEVTVVRGRGIPEEKANFVLDLASKPANFDISGIGPDGKKLEELRGIARIEKDKLTLCQAPAKAARPKDFTSTNENHCLLLVLERE